MEQRKQMQFRTINSKMEQRAEGDEMRIEGYFAVFNSPYEMWPGAVEIIAPGAFSKTLGGDVRALIDHETRLVIGRNTAGTLELREDSHGLWGSILINPKDTDATNLYERVTRGDVSQCSFGFNIIDEETEFREDGSVTWTIKEVKLYEVSVCTFPAYEETGVSARKRELEEIRKRRKDEWRAKMSARLKGDPNA